MIGRDREEEARLWAELRSLRLENGDDPFDLYRRGEVSKGWLIGKIVEVASKPGVEICSLRSGHSPSPPTVG